MTQVRVRFAPSPTGHLHIGGARTALINYAFAKANDGVFVLRIEDTDTDRSTQASFESILTSLKWLGLDWDEGIEKEGDCGPYRQSERFEIYGREAKKLLDAGEAYHCYCSPEELEERRELAVKQGSSSGYDNRCRDLSDAEKEKYEAEGKSPVVRFRVSQSGSIIIDDMVRGRVSFDPSVIGDFIIMRADGTPTFHFANVIDDLGMGITHVIRGDDHLSNTPRHALLFRAIGAEPPRFAHLSLILGPDGSRLSKRHGATSVEEFKAAGYLPEALVNCLAMLGFSPPDEEEVFGPDQFAKNFDLASLGKSAATFDRVKLDWFNAIYIRNADVGKLVSLCKPYLLDAGFDLGVYTEQALEEILDSVRGNMTILGDCAREASVYFLPIEELLEADALEHLRSNEHARAIIAALAEDIGGRDSISGEDIREIGKNLQKASGAKGKELYMPVRIAATGKLHGPELAKALPILGPEKVLARARKIGEMI
jgi:nondiscriminating glutamyl-tRNA synthetase